MPPTPYRELARRGIQIDSRGPAPRAGRPRAGRRACGLRTARRVCFCINYSRPGGTFRPPPRPGDTFNHRASAGDTLKHRAPAGDTFSHRAQAGDTFTCSSHRAQPWAGDTLTFSQMNRLVTHFAFKSRLVTLCNMNITKCHKAHSFCAVLAAGKVQCDACHACRRPRMITAAQRAPTP